MNIENIETEKLDFDPQNPRFYRLGRVLNLEETIEEMLEDEGVQDLMYSIGTKGYFLGEPILVVATGDRFTVVEGNRRLIAVKLLNGQIAAPPRRVRTIEQVISDSTFHPVSLPCVICDNRGDVLKYLGYRHVTGIKEWEALSKALYVERLLEEEQSKIAYREKLRNISHQIGSKPGYLAQLMTALNMYHLAQDSNFFGLRLTSKQIEFSLITTSLSYTNIREWLGVQDLYKGSIDKDIDTGNLKLMFQFLFVVRDDASTVIGESRELSDFNHVVAKREAIKVLTDTGDMEAALYLTDGPSEALTNFLDKTQRFLKRSWDHIGIGRIGEISDEQIQIAEDIRDLSGKLLSSMKSLGDREE